MVVSMLLDPTGVSTLRVTRGVGLGGTIQVATGVGVGVSSGGSCASCNTPANWTTGTKTAGRARHVRIAPAAYRKAFERLLRDLKAESAAASE